MAEDIRAVDRDFVRFGMSDPGKPPGDVPYLTLSCLGTWSQAPGFACALHIEGFVCMRIVALCCMSVLSELKHLPMQRIDDWIS